MVCVLHNAWSLYSAFTCQIRDQIKKKCVFRRPSWAWQDWYNICQIWSVMINSTVLTSAFYSSTHTYNRKQVRYRRTLPPPSPPQPFLVGLIRTKNADLELCSEESAPSKSYVSSVRWSYVDGLNHPPLTHSIIQFRSWSWIIFLIKSLIVFQTINAP